MQRIGSTTVRKKDSPRTARRVLAFAFLPLLLLVARLDDAQELVVAPFKPGGIYELGETAGWTVRLPAGADLVVEYRYTIKKNNFDVLKSGRLDLSQPATIETTLDEPAMLYVEIGNGDPATEDRVVAAAIAPERLRAPPEPADFDRFWKAKIGMLQEIPPNPQLMAKSGGREDVEYFTLRMDHIDGKHVWGQLAKPEREGRFPGLVIFQWASPPYPLQREWVTDHAAEGWLALNVQPHDVPPDEPRSYYDALPRELKEYHTIGRDDRDRNYFLQMYLGAYRAVEYLAGRPDWDGKTLVVTGTSMGGQQSLCAAAFNPRVTAVIVHVPAGADVLGPLHGRASGYPNWPVEDPKVRRTAPYFDAANCAARIEVPSLVSMGFLDTVTPPAGIFAAFNRIRGFKEAVPLVDAAHNHQATPEQQAPYTSRAREWMQTLLAGGDVAEPADRPSPRLDSNSRIAHEQLLKKKTEGRIDVYFMGDSITRRWGAAEPQYKELLDHWLETFHGWNAANFAWGGDRTQNILWRLEQGELDDVYPKVIVLMAGTNNVGNLTPVGDDRARVDAIASGIRAIVSLARKKAPDATIVITGITPRNDNLAVMPTIERINARIAKLADGEKIRYIDINDRLADENGVLFDGVTDDKLHLTLQGYQVWADELKPILTELLGPPAETDHAPPPTGDPSAM